MYAGNEAVLADLQRVAEDRRPAELFHERLCKLLKGVAQDHDLRFFAQRVQKVLRAGQRVNFRDDVLHVFELQPVLFQNAEPPAHEFIVIGLIARGAAQLGDAAFLRKSDPDLGHEHALQIKTDKIHTFASYKGFVVSLQVCAAGKLKKSFSV